MSKPFPKPKLSAQASSKSKSPNYSGSRAFDSIKALPISVAVRNGKCGTCPKLLTKYLSQCGQVAHYLPRTEKIKLYRSVLEVLMETICDDLIAKCWRGWSLDNIYTPLQAIRHLSRSAEEKQELARLETHMRTLSGYFLH